MKFLRNLKVLQKLILLISIFTISLLILGFVSISNLSGASNNVDTLYNKQLKPSLLLSGISINNRAINAYLLELLLTDDPERNEYLNGRVDLNIDQTATYFDELASMSLPSDIDQQLDKLISLDKEQNVIREKVRDLAMENKNEEAYQVFQNELEAKRVAINELFTDLEESNKEGSEQVFNEVTESTDNAKTTVIVTIILAIIITILVSLVIASLITRPLRKIQELLGVVENGDFTVKGDYQSKDEIGMLNASFNKMVEGVNTVIRTVGSTSEQVAAASEELSASAEQSTKASEHITETIQELVVGAENQVDIIRDSTNLIAQINHDTEEVMSNTEIVSHTVDEASRLSSEGRKVINEVNNQMKFIDNTVRSLVDSFAELSTRSREIGQIIEVITGIAAQTNLLALNAAIEAARAGESGKGFAVVADEVRKLAEESAKSARQISELVSAIQQDTDQTMKMVEDATGEVKQGMSVVHVAGDTFSEIETVIEKAVPQIESIKGNVEKLLTGTSHVNKSIIEVNEVATETAAGTQSVTAATEEQLASMEEITSSSQALASLAEDLQSLILKFKI
ncbi:methyl-accepting chemotaxis protein [Ureibacillus aquaedulcis]|uniref:Methyl-accepting chemotaxis protein n=1 Tax=Ureibacillus aquaedulcis TaxID=3058421 RepID=A0ABT8GNQ0_9BACL|nr:methyl-accepting chemotaxis protein [Ureibacillus sp. BA0131]MDN4493029.1 methyl-accepting chemotaxis protein [Ureibacillus sp. BA0131]